MPAVALGDRRFRQSGGHALAELILAGRKELPGSGIH